MEYVLGLDLGSRSLGWAAIEQQNGSDASLLGLGVRIFEAGMEGNFDAGKEASRAAARRVARGQRRQTRRRRQRARRLYETLAAAGLLPPVTHAPSRPLALEIQKALNELDRTLHTAYRDAAGADQLPYLLRARALDHPLEAFALGRALYHLNQRRGFQSNRKVKASADEEKGVVYGGINRLREEMGGKRTLGEYLAGLNPHEQRLRSRYTHRQMYRDEFRRIFEAQRPYHSVLTDEFQQKLASQMFDQRPLHSKEEEIGECEWIRGEKRAPLWSLEFQRFRLLQSVNHLRIIGEDKLETKLTAAQRERLVGELEVNRQLTFTRAKKMLGLAKETKFSIEEGKEKQFKGNAVAAAMLTHSGGLWETLDTPQREALLCDVAAAETNEETVAVLTGKWAMTAGQAQEFAEKFALPQGYARLSRRAMQAVMPHLEAGASVQEARQMAGFAVDKRFPVMDLLPPLAKCRQHGIDVRNPAVIRALTELRKVVNALIRKWGRPAEIHIELARDLKKNRASRERDSSQNRERESQRAKMRERIENEVGTPRDQITRAWVDLGLLFEECGGTCPYTGESLGSFVSLFGGNSRAQVEHIIPRSRSLDDSFKNLTLALTAVNAEKGNRTPYEAYGHNPEQYGQILARVKGFRGKDAASKLWRFRLEQTGELLEEFSSRQLNDTRYASRLAGEYLSLLYGGRSDENGRQRVFNIVGELTAALRGLWNLNTILNSDGQKSRDDHRHHAIDAAVTAVFRQKWMARLSEAAEKSWRERQRRFASIEPPWVGFKEAVQAAVEKMYVSHRPDHRVTGALHKETFYRPLQAPGQKLKACVRQSVHTLQPAGVALIVDQQVRKAVGAAIKNCGGNAKKLENKWPVMPNTKGQPVPIKRVRLQVGRAPQQVGTGWKRRWAERGETHHVAIVETQKGKRRVWQGDVVSMTEAYQRLKQNRPVIDRSEGDGRGFLFSLAKNDTVELQGEKQGLWVVKKITSEERVALTRHTDARLENKRENYAPTVNGLGKLGARKVSVTVLGEIQPCRD